MNNNKEQVCIRNLMNFLMHTLFFVKFIVLLEDLTCDHDNDYKNKKS